MANELWNLNSAEFNALMAQYGIGPDGQKYARNTRGSSLTLPNGQKWTPAGENSGFAYVPLEQQYQEYVDQYNADQNRGGDLGYTGPALLSQEQWAQQTGATPYYQIGSDNFGYGLDSGTKDFSIKYRDDGNGNMVPVEAPRLAKHRDDAYAKKFGLAALGLVGGGLALNAAGLGAGAGTGAISSGVSGMAPIAGTELGALGSGGASLGSGLTAGSGGLGLSAGSGGLGLSAGSGAAGFGGSLGQALAGVSTGVGGGSGLLGGLGGTVASAAPAAKSLGGVFSDIAGKAGGALSGLTDLTGMSVSDMLKLGVGAAGLVSQGNNTPDYMALAQKQADLENAMLDKQTLANRPNQINAAGDTSNWLKDPTSGQWTQDVSFSGANQSKYDAIQAQQAKLLEQIRNQKALTAGPLTTKLDLSGIGSVGTYNPSPYAGGF